MLDPVPGVRSLAAAVVAVVVVAGCTANGFPQTQRSTTTSTEVTGPPSPRPQRGECRGLITSEIIGAATDVRPPVACDQPHGSETVLVADLPPHVSDLSHREATALTNDSSELRGVLDECDVAFEDYVGVSRIDLTSVRESTLSRVFFLPGFDDWARGARWLRCDVVTEPLNGEVTRGVDRPLRGILDQQPLPAELRPCYRDVSPPPRLAFGFPTSCDQPHHADVLLRFQVTDPKVDEVAADRVRLEEHAKTAFIEPCSERVAALVGLTQEALFARRDISVSSRALHLSRWAEEPDYRRVQCIAFTTSQLTVGSLEGLGDRPLPRPA